MIISKVMSRSCMPSLLEKEVRLVQPDCRTQCYKKGTFYTVGKMPDIPQQHCMLWFGAFPTTLSLFLSLNPSLTPSPHTEEQ